MPIEIESPEEMGYNTIRYNLAESSVRDISTKNIEVDWKELVLFYGEHKGLKKLREAIIEDSNVLNADDVLVTTGAATALFIVSTALLDHEDHMVVIRPNYGTNIETPRAIKCDVTIVDVRFEDEFEIPLDAVRNAIRPGTKLISITNPHNPTGRLYENGVIKELVSLAEEHNCYLLVDETYRDLNFKTQLNPYVAEMSEKVISVSSVSKSFGAPGIRIGWLINRNPELMHDFLAAKEQICLCNSVIDEEVAWYLLQQKNAYMHGNHAHIRANFAYLEQWFSSQPYLEWVKPQAGVVCFPRLKDAYKLNTEKFYKSLYADYGTIVGPGHWFEQDKVYMRIGFGYPLADELKQGLANLKSCLEANLL